MQEENFFFGGKKADSLMSKINLRDIGSRAKEWEHPYRGFLKMLEPLRNNGDILNTPKKSREIYAVSIFALSLQHDTKLDWWMNVPETDPPDGLVMALSKEDNNAFKGLIREVEVVEHRDNKITLFERIQEKLRNTSYTPDTTLICLILCPGTYDLESLSKKLTSYKLELEHIFLVFNGGRWDDVVFNKDINFNFSLVQLLPQFKHATFDLREQFKDFERKYNIGQELRIINGNNIYYGTTNKKALKQG